MAQFDMSTLDTVEAYQLITRLVAPRPIALVSTLDASGQGNLAPFSYFTMGGSNPPSCVICPVNNRHGEAKDTLRNLEQTGEYVISVCTRPLADAVNQCSYPYGPEVDEFEQSGLSRRPSLRVAPPGVAESPVQLECKLHQLVRHGQGPLASNYVVGEILLVHVADELLVDGLPDDGRIEFIGRLGANYYTHVNAQSLFELGRPDKP